MKNVKTIAAIHSLCSIGNLALSNIISILSIMGHQVCPIPTVIFSNLKSKNKKQVVIDNSRYIEECREQFKEDGIDFKIIVIGYLGSDDAIDGAARFANSYPSAITIIDSIFADDGEYLFDFDINYVNSLKQLLSVGDIIIQNYTEACFLTGEEYKQEFNEWKIRKICYKLKKIGVKKVIITKVPAKRKSEICVAIYEDGELQIISKRKKESSIQTRDMFVSVFIGYYLKGKGLKEAVIKAWEFICVSINESNKVQNNNSISLEICLKRLSRL